jgi:hypothetical protein
MRDFQDSSELIEVDMPQGGELVEMARQVQSGNATSIPVRGSLLGRRHGIVQGYWSFTKKQWRPSQVRLLPEGVRMKVPAGRAINVLDNYNHCGTDEWICFEFPRAGMMCGPLLWGEDDRGMANERWLVLQRTKGPREKKSAMFALAYAGFMLVVAFFGWGSWADFLGNPEHLTTSLFIGRAILLIGAVTSYACLVPISRVIEKRLARKEHRKVTEFQPDRGRMYRFPVSKKIEDLVDYLSSAAKAHPEGKTVDAIDEGLATALGSYRATYLRVEQEAGLSGGTKALLRHTRKLTDEISNNILAAPHLMADDDLRRDFLELVGRAEADLHKALKAKQVDEVDSVKADIETLRAQIEKHGVAA